MPTQQTETVHTHSDFLLMGLLLALGLLAGRGASRVGLPRVAAYLLVGLLFSDRLRGDLLDFHMERVLAARRVKSWNGT